MIRYIMKVIYANDKYSMGGMKYILALVGATFYIFVTLFLLFAIIIAVIPSIYTAIRSGSFKLPSYPLAIIFVILISVALSMLVKEDQLKENDFTKKSLNRAVNYLLIYAIGGVLLAGIIIMKLFGHMN